MDQHLSTPPGRIGTRSSPLILTKGADQDERIYTIVDSDGHLPAEVSSEIIEEFDKFRDKLGRDFAVAIRNSRINQLARLGATLYAGCPEAIVSYYRQVVVNGISFRLVLYAGRVLRTCIKTNLLIYMTVVLAFIRFLADQAGLQSAPQKFFLKNQ